jgi:hypothetical protein
MTRDKYQQAKEMFRKEHADYMHYKGLYLRSKARKLEKALLSHHEREACTNCRFYISQQCHRNAPFVMNKDKDSFPNPMWPFMINDNWCGEWEGKE